MHAFSTGMNSYANLELNNYLKQKQNKRKEAVNKFGVCSFPRDFHCKWKWKVKSCQISCACPYYIICLHNYIINYIIILLWSLVSNNERQATETWQMFLLQNYIDINKQTTSKWRPVYVSVFVFMDYVQTSYTCPCLPYCSACLLYYFWNETGRNC